MALLSSLEKAALLLPFSGAAGSTSFVDYSRKAVVPVAVGNAQISTADSKYYGSSLYLDGSGDRVSITGDLSLFRFGTGDFTIACWIKTTDSGFVPLDFYASSTGVYQIWVENTGYTQFYTFGGAVVAQTAGKKINNGAWTHLAVTRSAGTIRLFIDGEIVASATDTRNYNTTTPTAFTIGAQPSNGSYDTAGHLNDVIVLKGDASWTANFTPPGPLLTTISGTVFDNAGAPCARTVRAYDRATGIKIGADAVSDAATGAYTIAVPSLAEIQRIVLDDTAGTLYNDLIDRIAL